MAKRSSQKKGKMSIGAALLKRKRKAAMKAAGIYQKKWKKKGEKSIDKDGIKRNLTPRFEPGSKRPQALKEILGAQRREMTAGYKRGDLINMALQARIPFTNDMSEDRLIEELGNANVLAPKASLYAPYAPQRLGDRPRVPRPNPPAPAAP